MGENLNTKLAKLPLSYLQLHSTPNFQVSVHESFAIPPSMGAQRVSMNTVQTLQWTHGQQAGLLAGAKDGIIRYFADGTRLTAKRDEFKGHSGTVHSISTCTAPNMEDIFASAGQDKCLRIWDTRQKNPTFVDRTKEELLFCQFSNRDGSVLATSNYNDEICFYDTKMWKIAKQIKFPREVNCLMWNLDDSVFFIADSSGRINLFDGQILEATSLEKPEVELQGLH